MHYLDSDEKILYWNQKTKGSKIAVFGDCNLQSYSNFGTGICGSLSYELGYPVYNAGRKLIFGNNEKPLTKGELKQLLKYDIVIYVAFASAPYVRTVQLDFRNPRLEYK